MAYEYTGISLVIIEASKWLQKGILLYDYATLTTLTLYSWLFKVALNQLVESI